MNIKITGTPIGMSVDFLFAYGLLNSISQQSKEAKLHIWLS